MLSKPSDGNSNLKSTFSGKRDWICLFLNPRGSVKMASSSQSEAGTVTPVTPKKQKLQTKMATNEPDVFALSSVSNMIRSPNTRTNWFEFSVQSLSHPEKRRVSCYDGKIQHYLKSHEMLNDPSKGIRITNLTKDHRNEKQYKWSAETILSDDTFTFEPPLNEPSTTKLTIQHILMRCPTK